MTQALLHWVNVCTDDQPPVETLQGLANGERFADVLEFTLGADAGDISVHRGSDNAVMHRSNINRVVQVAAEFAAEHLGAPGAAESVEAAVDVAAVARDKDGAAIGTLGHILVAVSILGGNPAVLEKVRTLAKPDQEELQRAVKATMSAHGMSKRKKAAASTATATPTPAVGHEAPVSRVTQPEMRILIDEKEDLQRQLTEAKDALDEKTRGLEALERDHADIVARYNRAVDEAASGDTARVRELRQDLERQQAAHAELEAENAKLRRTDDEQRQALRDAEEGRARLMEQVHDAATGRKAAEEREAALRSEATVARDLEEAAKKRRDGLQEEVTALRDENSALQKQTQEAKGGQTEAAQALSEAAAELADVKAKLGTAEARVAAMENTKAESLNEDAALVEELRAQLREERAANADHVRRTAEQQPQPEAAPAPVVDTEAQAQLEQHLQRALREIEELKHRKAAPAADSDEATLRVRDLEQENAGLKDALEAAHASFRQQHAAANAAVIEAGQSNMRLQQQLLAGGTAVPAHELLSLKSRDGEHTVLHTMRRRMELGVLRSLSQMSHNTACGTQPRSQY